MLVESAYLALGILGKRLRVNHILALITTILHDNPLQTALFSIFQLLGPVLARQLLGVNLLVPHFKQKCAAMVLQRCQVSVDVHIGIYQVIQHIPSLLHTLRVQEDSTNKRLKDVTEDL